MKRTFEIASLNCEHTLFELWWKSITHEQRLAINELKKIPLLKEWYDWNVWWKSLTHEQRLAFIDKNWTYD
jgi:hypothetical protein